MIISEVVSVVRVVVVVGVGKQSPVVVGSVVVILIDSTIVVD